MLLPINFILEIFLNFILYIKATNLLLISLAVSENESINKWQIYIFHNLHTNGKDLLLQIIRIKKKHLLCFKIHIKFLVRIIE